MTAKDEKFIRLGYSGYSEPLSHPRTAKWGKVDVTLEKEETKFFESGNWVVLQGHKMNFFWERNFEAIQ